MHVLLNQLGILMNEEEDMRIFHSHKHIYRFEMNQ
jgi:hypothetical protein